MSMTPLTDRIYDDPRDCPNEYVRNGYTLFRPAFSDPERLNGLSAWAVLNDGSEISLWRHPTTVRLYEARGGVTAGTMWTGVGAWCAAIQKHVLKNEEVTDDA
ncbi:hypothetical protein [Cognatiyoonia sp.]|uniref:hypothetical protein n=1 Tax=Cognatiyoonia sp. TaxID=2211652 RepID=UPI003F6A03CB